MWTVFPAETDVTLTVNFVLGDGTAAAPTSAKYRVKRDDETVVTDTTIILGQGETSAQITIGYTDNTVRTGRIREMMVVEVDGVDANGSLFLIETVYVIENREVLVVGENSFAKWHDMLLEAIELRDLTKFASSSYTDRDRKEALASAYFNLVQLPFNRVKMGLYPEDALFSADTIAKVTARHAKRLRRAQIIEADNILGGNPIEDRRRAGLISDSAGESAHFFRSGKPLELPCCRKAATELGPLLSWSWGVGR